MNKDEMRALHHQIRLRMSRGEVSTKSRLIGRKLLNEIQWNDFDNVCAFEPINQLNEVDIRRAAAKLRASGKNIEILSTARNAKFPQADFDMILVPCLAFDKELYRLGWGGGWYDRFLARQSKALKIGLAYQSGFIDGCLPHEPHDVQLDKIITESLTY